MVMNYVSLNQCRQFRLRFSQFRLRLIPLRLRLAQLSLQGVQLLAHVQQKMLQRIHFGAQRGTTRTREIGGYRLHAGVIGPSTRKLNRNPVNGNIDTVSNVLPTGCTQRLAG